MNITNSLKTVPLHSSNLLDAQNLLDEIFGNLYKRDKMVLSASLKKESNKRFLDREGIEDLWYELLIAPNSNEIIGITGIYSEIGEEDKMCWLGWFGIAEPYRKKGFGRILLEYTCNRAKLMNKQIISVYTTDASKYQDAITLYKKSGFDLYDRVGRTIFFRKALY